MSPRVLFYVSGHGFGHARRMSQVIRALAAVAPAIEVHVRTAAPRHVFDPWPVAGFGATELDAGMAEDGPLRIDPAGTLRRLECLLERRDAIVADEVAAVRAIAPRLIVADVPFLAGDVAAAAGVPCVAVSNFTWDWICDPLLSSEPGYAAVRERMRAGYAAMRTALRLPFGEMSDAFREVVPVPLVAGSATREPADVLRSIGLDPADDRPRVLVALRGGVSPAALAAAARESRDWLLLTSQGGVSGVPENVRPFTFGPQLDFSDLLAACDVVVCKLGYGIVADCLAGGRPIVWPRRVGFREDGIVERDGPRYLRMREVSHDDFARGAWRAIVGEAMGLPPPPERMRTDGAEVVAAWIAGACDELR